MERERDDNRSLSRAGARRKLTEADRDRLYDIATNQNPHIEADDLMKNVADGVSKRTVRRALRETREQKRLKEQRPGPAIEPQPAA